MSNRMKLKNKVMTTALAGVLGLGAIGAGAALLPSSSVDAAATMKAETPSSMALHTLMGFYKPALQGKLGTSTQGFESFVVGKTTRSEVIKAVGEAEAPRTSANGFDYYHAEMGHPGYAIAYNNNVIKEIRYFGTNIERQTNIGGMTMQMVKQHWYAPTSTSTFMNGKIKQTKLTYNRGNYKIEFIFNSPTNLDHINLLKK